MVVHFILKFCHEVACLSLFMPIKLKTGSQSHEVACHHGSPGYTVLRVSPLMICFVDFFLEFLPIQYIEFLPIQYIFANCILELLLWFIFVSLMKFHVYL